MVGVGSTGVEDRVGHVRNWVTNVAFVTHVIVVGDGRITYQNGASEHVV